MVCLAHVTRYRYISMIQQDWLRPARMAGIAVTLMEPSGSCRCLMFVWTRGDVCLGSPVGVGLDCDF